MRTGKTAAVCACAMAAAIFMTGCQNSALTEEEIVTLKEEGSDGAADDEREIKAAAAGAIAEQVQAPAHYAWEGGSERISVRADADLTIPDAEGFKSYKVTGRVFEQEDYDKVNRVLLKGEQLWERDQEKMGDSHGFTAEEIDGRIAQLEERKARAAKEQKGEIVDEATGKSFDELIDEWKILKKAAPDEVSTVVISPEVNYEENAENMEDNFITGTATVDGTDYIVFFDNNWADDWPWISFLIERSEYGNFSSAADEAEIASAGISPEEARQKAKEAAAAMGFEGFSVAGEEYRSDIFFDEISGKSGVEKVGYAVHLTRCLDGIPVTYTYADGTTSENDGIAWPYEKLEMIYTDEGLARFYWCNPYVLEKTSDEYRFLLPFSEIQGIFEEMIVKKYEDFFEKADVEVSLTIDRVKLGYMRVRENGSGMEGEMIPVWDFFGSETLKYPEMEEPYVDNMPYGSLITINGLDGTIIDRGLGY